ncbi:MAG TPA: hypothetical protein PLL28_05595 [Chitinophagales bacterium]|nr:hypothetical protein [Chitinophagales bacterium]HMU70627.1 hypothetical protein [Chitinophagales bacterium]HMX04438.1 hypothetical protein [Chitinophagales bacterium]HMZ88695.1 hypothetical protein [Chitinophagales bacterium]HNE45219.1 hypothetical protein [Chitinophagales bacterium]
MINFKNTGFAVIAILMTASFISCGDENQADEKTPAPLNRSMFYGKITYTSTTSSPDSVFLATMSTFSPHAVDIYFGKSAFRMVEHGGLSNGNILVLPESGEAWQLDSTKMIAYLGEYSDLGDPSDALKDLMPDHFAPTVKATGKTANILGIPCTEYYIVRSGIIPKEDSATIMVANTINFPSSRYDVQTEINHAAVPAPLFLGYEDGAIMQMTVVNKRYTRKFEITALQENYFPEGIFDIPANFQKK